ncbi:baseplate J/gp47 family protein [Ochrobactrum sp. A-1]|uniref:baseplate J/gp47 family protein n=1 Tax=Ochrobactrum sp. A-1 TaxID=2920940 RepID=UPI001F0B04D8|nr:baseplate J/gp47 family protein [Ochrobactrum sp. A-1]
MAIDLTLVPLPDVIETLDYETILNEMVADFKERWAKVREMKPELPAYNVEMLETDPVKIVIEAFAYRELLWRARANQVARAVMLATATGTDLDNFAADFGMTRRIIGYSITGNPVYESDEEFRQRRNLAPDGYAAAGPEDAYRYYAWSADGSIKQVKAIKGENNRCDVILLGREADGTVSQDVVTKVYGALSPKTRRPLTDNVYVRSATIVSQVIRVKVTAQTGPDVSTTVAKAKASIQDYASSRSAIGTVLRADGIIAAAHNGNALESVVVIEPAADVDPGKYGTVYVPEVIVEVA